MADIRDSKTKVWEPSAGTKDEDSSGGSRLALGVSTAGVNEDSIDMTTLIVKAKGETVFAGRGGGSIVTSETSSGKMHSLLYSDAKDIFTTAVAHDCQL